MSLKIDWNYYWDIHDNKASITFEIEWEIFQFHVVTDYYIPMRIKRKLTKKSRSL